MSSRRTVQVLLSLAFAGGCAHRQYVQPAPPPQEAQNLPNCTHQPGPAYGPGGPVPVPDHLKGTCRQDVVPPSQQQPTVVPPGEPAQPPPSYPPM